MSQLQEGPQITEALTPEEWVAEQNSIFVLRDSTRFLADCKKAADATYHRTRREVQLARDAREAEDAWQEARREEIRRENEAEAAGILAQACTSCFCIHAGEC